MCLLYFSDPRMVSKNISQADLSHSRGSGLSRDAYRMGKKGGDASKGHWVTCLLVLST